MATLVEVENLAVAFPTVHGWERVVDGVSLTVGEGEAAGLVGESACGKTLTALALVGLIPEPGTIVSGRVFVAGKDIVGADERSLCSLRGGSVGLVLQEPARALNPLRSVGSQVSEAARLHLGISAGQAGRLATELVAEVGLEDPRRLVDAYPHQLSGGQRQRVLLACALSAGPKLLIADEPTSALDTVSQQQLVELFEDLCGRRDLALLFISHDLGLVGRLARRVIVLYAGETVEIADREVLWTEPKHPYTQALMHTRLAIERDMGERFGTIPGTVPHSGDWGGGCRFAARCPFAMERCHRARPALARVDGGRQVRCFLVSDEEEPSGRG
jgi:peptide/nickel transport system ATP-binding protein